ncbi:MAG: SUF system NifU family Fe-S cluster assembly protein [Candidatus Kapabacteria bacterium]|jgi:nitrogen fixation NifU-like protein|nr:SUF system NifU family Fe-S cluster assembly protein [Candidatus Kapabacteria bacterium]
MKNELNDLYQEVILDHNKNPRNFGDMHDANHSAAGHNPLCGDHIDVDLKVKDGIIEDVKFHGAGCAISKASASIMTTTLIGQSVEEAKEMFKQFVDIVTTDPEEEIDTLNLGKLAVFCGVREFPARVKCASLAWHTMKNALDDESGASTE